MTILGAIIKHHGKTSSYCIGQLKLVALDLSKSNVQPTFTELDAKKHRKGRNLEMKHEKGSQVYFATATGNCCWIVYSK